MGRRCPGEKMIASGHKVRAAMKATRCDHPLRWGRAGATAGNPGSWAAAVITERRVGPNAPGLGVGTLASAVRDSRSFPAQMSSLEGTWITYSAST